jgi:hypothetical protein
VAILKPIKTESTNKLNQENEIQQEEDYSKEELQEAILEIKKKRQGYFQNRNNSSNSNRSYQPNRSYQNGSTQNGSQNQSRFCLYCKKNGHMQEKCFERKRKNHAHVGKDGRPMRTPGTPEFNFWKNELAEKGKKVMIINDNSNESASARSVTLN